MLPEPNDSREQSLFCPVPSRPKCLCIVVTVRKTTRMNVS